MIFQSGMMTKLSTFQHISVGGWCPPFHLSKLKNAVYYLLIFDKRGKIIFIKDLVEIVVILPNPVLFCISGNIPVNLNYSWLKNSMSGGK